MNEIIYLDPSEEITGVIDRLRATDSAAVSFVIPRGATIAQSIVNLKLLKKSASEMGKEISLIATDRISRNLASQIGLTVYSKVSEAERAKPEEKPIETPKPLRAEKEDEATDGQFKVNNYYRNKKDEIGDDEQEEIKNELKEMAEKEKEAPASEMELNKRPVEEAPHDEDASVEEIEPKTSVPREKPEHVSSKRERESMNFSSNIKSNPGKPTNIKGSRKPIIVLVSIAALVLIAVGYIFLPYTTVAVQIKTSDYSAEKEVTIDRNAKEKDASKLFLPGKLLEQEKDETKTFDATGKKDIGEKAAGTITFSNIGDSGKNDTIPAGTTVKSVNGSIEFTLDAALSVPGPSISGGQIVPGRATGKVTAKDPGEKGNLPAGSNFSVAGKPFMAGAGQTTGGVSKEVKVVTASDLAKAEEAVKQEISDAGKNDLINLAKENKVSIFDNSEKSEIISSSASKNEGDQADKFDYSVKIKLYAIGFVKADLDNLLIDNLNSSLGGDKMLVNPEKADIKYDLKNNDIDSGVLTVDADFVGKEGQKISEGAIKDQIKGKSVSKAKNLISGNSGVENVQVTNWPKAMPELPWLTKRIKVTFDYAK